ncbi:MAG: LLM class flavin-dependent oxidoreductase [Gammaproteobacteria bacterium]|nr:LLM class flavin-dependent oxidoreductase [Gammaproteobacteria bacterium]
MSGQGQSALKHRIKLGTVLPHRAVQPIPPQLPGRIARRAEALGFADLWVTENTLDHAFCLDPMVALSHAAACTSRIRLGVSVVVLPTHNPIHVAHQTLSLDHLSEGRAMLAVGIGRPQHYAEFQVPTARRVRRFNEAVAVIRALWQNPVADYQGEIFELHGANMGIRPVQQPTPPLWMGGGHPDAVRRAARLADGWMGAGSQDSQAFAECVPILRAALSEAGRDPAGFTVSKRVFMAVDDKPARARAMLHRWFTEVYRTEKQTDSAGVYGTPEQVREQLEALVEAGAEHLVLNLVDDYEAQLEALVGIIG